MAAATGFARLWSTAGVQPLLTLPVFEQLGWLGPVAGVAALLVGAIVNDFFFYWQHRAQHRFLWRFHAVHHSITDLSAVNSYHHASEALVAVVLHTLPASLLVAATGPELPVVGFFLWLHIVWIHSPTRAHLGPLAAVFVDNRFHRIHHSVEERHFDRNFGAFTTLWDRLFGTAYLPQPDEWPQVGLAEAPAPRTVGEWWRFPGRYRASATPPSGQPASFPA